MAEFTLSKADEEQIKAKGMELEKIISQTETIMRGIPYLRLQRPCIIGDGITLIQKGDLERLSRMYSEASLAGRVMKFVPASGAASRMFKLLLSFNNRLDPIDKEVMSASAARGDSDSKEFLQFINGIEKFAFYDHLKAVMAKDGLDTEDLVSKGQFKDILEYILTSKGLDYANLPKGMIMFHRYPDHSRTPFEEHLVEAAGYVQDRHGVCRIHFTVSNENEETIKTHIEKIRNRYETSGLRMEITFSVQKPSTDTLAVDVENRPFRDTDGRLLFRPGGHGALLENLNDLKGDMVFIKNIDNVVPDRLKHETYVYKKAFGGYLIELQRDIFGYLKRLAEDNVDEQVVNEAFEYVRHKLSIMPPDRISRASMAEKTDFLFSRLNRPLRICGMVRNEGEPGGGPFWVENGHGTLSLQIVESSQVDMNSVQQRAIWESSTHFNPVDLLCGVRDYLGRPFDLLQFADANTGFVSIKSKEGRELKALELPGLWNGAMAFWNTVFIEVPLITFNPVKTIIDLLRAEHKSAPGG